MRGLLEAWRSQQYPVSDRRLGIVVEGDSMTAPEGAEFSFPEGTPIPCDPENTATACRFVTAKNVAKQTATFKRLVSDRKMQYSKHFESVVR